ncbi:MAG: membrane protein [Gammaproteobacteria bacterium (ex Lamellibrachia satsuma)]|nr:MAG: FtsH protease activity modulator HflK [Gammaproteobacteria bacterium (ex Lamellibrachia satsuma)]RRS34623.1 MAG: membrane protein [Gammaproteobacteria bacterium (ex Lamellibrachia satsuma)]RRS37468.1 MAG: membrane protein [Gammaproteobacteria bacterium (ex Lamellibrachia satsuma)]
MAWNEPGGGKKDPWSGKGGDQGPPDLDEVVKKLQDKFGGMFGGGGGKSNGSDSGGGISGPGGVGIGAIALVLLLIWMATGIYIIEPAERGVILRFGAYSETTQPGPHWHLPYPIEEVYKVNVDQITSFRHKATMLTRDENIVDIELTVQSRIQDAGDYLFQDQNPEKTIRDAIETSVREVIGKSDLDYIMTEGRSAVAENIKSNAQEMLNFYKTGLEITSVNTQPAKPPEQVKSAFDDAIKAREDKERLENKAEAYANEIVPQARGEAARKIADGKAYRDRVIAEAEGEVSRFLAVLKEYEKAPRVTRERLYIDAVETVLGQSSKVMLDTKEGNSLMYLPLDKMMGGTDTGYQSGGRGGYTPEGARKQAPTTENRDQSRGRRVR